MKKRILYISGTRADYGLMRSVLVALHDDPDFDLTIAVTGMHLMPEFGRTRDEISADGFSIREVDAVFENDSRESMSAFVGKCISLLTILVKEMQPDAILLLGDRGEMLAGAITGTYLGIPVFHIHGGEITSTVDEQIRHAITKLAHIHLPATRKSAARIRKLGEDPSRIHVVGAPGLDAIVNGEFSPVAVIANRYQLDLSRPFMLVVQHPVSEEVEAAGLQARETCEAIATLSVQTVMIYPNADAGGRRMIQVIRKYEHLPFMSVYQSIPHADYLGLMRVASVLVGNSSSGIIEAPSFHLPVINIGTRQSGRERSCNVIDVRHDRNEIAAAVRRVISDQELKKKINRCKNPYGNGNTKEKIRTLLKKIDLSAIKTQKVLQYR